MGATRLTEIFQKLLDNGKNVINNIPHATLKNRILSALKKSSEQRTKLKLNQKLMK